MITILNITILGMELGLLIEIYLFPLVILYGCLSSLVSDYITRRTKGFLRFFLAGLIHLFFAILFLIPILISERTNDLNVMNIVGDIFLMQSIMCSILFWLLDELLRTEKINSKWRRFLNKTGDLRI
jgi:LytS/YehU family sensor histidine kinase